MELPQFSTGDIFAWFLLFMVLGCMTVALIAHALYISQTTPVPEWRPRDSPIHMLVVLGSGGHTAEMLTLLWHMRINPTRLIYRTYVVTSGDSFSAAKAVEFESTLSERGAALDSYSIVTVPRARRVHQSFFTAPFTTLLSFWSCFLVLRGRHPDQRPLPAVLPSPYPDIIFTNGPATAVCVILAAKLLRAYHYCRGFLVPIRPQSVAGENVDGRPPVQGKYRLRTIFVESWARVRTLSLSGKILLPLADRFLVQWPGLSGMRAWPGMKKTEYAGCLVD
ncbi:glycosyltransferase family 1 protein [Aspergillus egyptiacus]|nr:glycosyltransferase family 1 protein [Aspergillus egyptiacus]